MTLLSMISSQKQIAINLSSPNQTLTHSNEQEYIFSVTIISPTIICTVTQFSLKFYSINSESKNLIQSHSQDQLIGELSVQDFRKEFNKIYVGDNEKQLLISEDPTDKHSDQLKKQTDFTNPTIIQQKGTIYNPKTNKFSLLITTTHNKYLIQFKINIQQSSSQHQSILPEDFTIVYNFAKPDFPIKYNLEMDPLLLYLQQSQTIVLIRKFYSDSLVIVLRNNRREQQVQLWGDELKRNSSNQYAQKNDKLSRTYKLSQQSQQTISDRLLDQPEVFWQFYINEQCLSVLENQRYLVNFRQIITKHTIQIDLIDVINKDKISFKLTQAIQPMTIRHIQLITSQSNLPTTTNKSKPQSFVLRIFSIPKYKQATLVIDYDVVHGVVLRTFLMEDVLVERVSNFIRKGTDYCLVNFLYHDKNLIGILKRDFLNEEVKMDIKFIQELLMTAVQLQMDFYTWNQGLGMLVQYKNSVRNQSLTLNLNKVINKNTFYINILDQLKQTDPILQDNQFLAKVYQILTHE